MNERRSGWRLALAIVLLSVAGPAIIRVFSQGQWWDEAVYLGLARALAAGHYTLEPGAAVESFRPPLFPFLLFLLGGHEIVARIFAGLGTVAALLLVGRLGDSTRDEFPTPLLLALCVPGLILCGCKILSESIFVILSAGAYLSMRRVEAGHGSRWSGLAGLLLGLAFSTRYVGLLTIGCTMLALLFQLAVHRKGGRDLLATLAGLGMALVPFALMGMRYHGSPLGMLAEYQRVYSAAHPGGLWQGLWGIGMTLNVLVPLMVLGFATLRSRVRDARPSDLLLGLLTISSLLLYTLASHQEPRYLVSFIWVHVPVAAWGFLALRARLGQAGRYLRPGLIIIATLGVGVATVATVRDANVGRPIIQGARYLKTITAPGDKVFTVSAPYVYYGAERTPVFEPEQNAIIPFMRGTGIRTVLLDRFEAGNPPFLNDFFDRHPEAFDNLRTFPGRGLPDAVVVYRLREPTD